MAFTVTEPTDPVATNDTFPLPQDASPQPWLP